MEQRKIIQNATRRNKLKSGGTDVNETIEAEGNLQDVIELLANLRKNKEPLLHCSVFIELKARSVGALKELQSDIAMELTRSKISVDRLTLRQKEGFLSVIPTGYNQFGAQYERVLPASSVANLYPFNFSGKTDPQGLYLGRDKYGTNILVDFDRRAEDKTTSNILILGNSGQGKSYLLKLILTNIRESGKAVICLDPESEYEELCSALGGCYIDFTSGEYTINPLEPKAWTDGIEDLDATTPEAFKKVTRLSQHIAFLKDFFRSYKDFTDTQIDTIEILLSKLYTRFGITDATDYSTKKPTDFPIMEDFYKLCEEEFYSYDKQRKYLYTEDTLQDVCLGIHSMCVGAESKYFNGHTNITDSHFLVFGVKGLMDTNKRLKDAMLFNILSFMGLSADATEDNSLDLQIKIAEIEAEFQKMLKAIAADNVEAFDEGKAKALMDEKAKLQIQLDRIADTKQKRENAKSRLDEIFAILEALANHPISYDDQIVRQILESVIVESKEKIKVVFIGGLEVTQKL